MSRSWDSLGVAGSSWWVQAEIACGLAPRRRVGDPCRRRERLDPLRHSGSAPGWDVPSTAVPGEPSAGYPCARPEIPPRVRERHSDCTHVRRRLETRWLAYDPLAADMARDRSSNAGRSLYTAVERPGPPWGLLSEGQRVALDQILGVPEGEGSSGLDRWRTGQAKPSGKNLERALSGPTRYKRSYSAANGPSSLPRPRPLPSRQGRAPRGCRRRYEQAGPGGSDLEAAP